MSENGAKKHWDNLVQAWPVIVTIGGLFAVLFAAFFDQLVDERISEVVPNSANMVELRAELRALKDTVEDENEDGEKALNRVADQVNRVEGKLDDLILILQRNNQ